MRAHALALLGAGVLSALPRSYLVAAQQDLSASTYVDSAGHDALDVSLVDIDEDTDFTVTAYTSHGQKVKVHVDVDFGDDQSTGWGSKPHTGSLDPSGYVDSGSTGGSSGSNGGSGSGTASGYGQGSSSGGSGNGSGSNGQTPTVLHPAPYPYCDPHSHDGLVGKHNVTMWYNETSPSRE